MTLSRLLRPARLLLATTLFALAILPAAAMAQWRDIPYADVVKMPLMLDKVDPGHVFRFRLQAQPGKGLTVTVRGRVKGNIPGDDFSKAFLTIWLGPSPPNKGLKAGLLGK